MHLKHTENLMPSKRNSNDTHQVVEIKKEPSTKIYTPL